MVNQPEVDVVSRLRTFLHGVADLVPNDALNIEELIKAGEHLIAFENLCTQLYEYGVVLTSCKLQAVEQLATKLGADRRFHAWLSADAEEPS